jgi:hypothetical protein
MSDVKQLIHWHLTYTWLIKSVDVESALGLVCNCNSALHRKCLIGTCAVASDTQTFTHTLYHG